MARELFLLQFVDLDGQLSQESSLGAVPRVGDLIELPDKRVAGVVDLITWLVPESVFGAPVVRVRLKPHA